ncbi:Uncharacterized protein FKW44_018759, partial [Caligus rogercresseyi]
ATQFSIGWSYLVSWIGLSFTLLSSIFFLASSLCIKRELKAIRRRHASGYGQRRSLGMEAYATLPADGGL